jgi:lysozyme family protein
MKSNYETCQAITLKWEGGDSDNKADPGGKTRWGVTQVRYDEFRKSKGFPAKSVFTMDHSEMLEIYKTGYWDAVSGDTLPLGVDLAVWDYGVNSGPARANSTLRAVKSTDAVAVVKELCAKRMSFLQGLKTFKSFGKGWSNRVADIEAKGVAMALKAASPATAQAELVKRSQEASDKGASTDTVALGSARAGGGASVASGAATVSGQVDQWVSTGLLVVGGLAVVLAIYFVVKARHDKARAQAYLNAASEIA